MILRLFIVTLFTLTMGIQAQAAPISPVSATVLHGTLKTSFGTANNPDHVIDGVIDFDQFLSFEDSDYAWVQFDLGTSYDLSGIRLWNNGGSNGNDGEGVFGFHIDYLNEAQNEYLGSAAWWGPSDGVLDVITPQDFALASLASDGVRYIDMYIYAGFGAGYSIFHEIMFEGELSASVPAPGALVLLGLGLGGVAARRRAAASN